MEIKAAHKRTRGTYGPERLKTDLAEHGVMVGVRRIRRIRKKLEIRCKLKRSWNSWWEAMNSLSRNNYRGQGRSARNVLVQ
jgi:hypothetical protein